MSVADKVKAFFDTVAEVWAVIPGPLKVFVYSTLSAVIGLWAAGELTDKSVILIVLTNLGLYQAPRTISTQAKKLF